MKNRRTQILRKKNSRIIVSRTKEADMILDLAQKTDEIFFKLRNLAGIELEYEQVDTMLEAWEKIMVKTSEALRSISSRLDLEYIEPSLISISKEKIK
ncbi:hypothetical protein DMB95_08920 [Campylobacter sp. MIT 12-8780]|uniref:hypothetical protein n=1 Tax=unclassified Campylobacter TaxID=2593542 RepID=UPI00115D1758|nr:MULTISPECIES: hypothetical protein [unclassified Campylobacter]NDJ27926.1 hypothetical protein [Campylobacter sp. MIT 19-121]TQR40142.1 hypothetical protein DMB95_08920 [Campylobacter sp. MIT 12-8780]